MSKTNIDEVKLGGAKRKNGHKSTCSCHICENMKNKAKRGGYTEEMQKKEEYISGGLKKKNGHRKDCKCPICKNMRNSNKNKKSGKRKTRKIKGGNDNDGSQEDNEDTTDDEDTSDEDTTENEDNTNDKASEDEKGGKKMKNGHKYNCKCPICKNMKKAGGDDVFLNKEDIEKEMDFQGGKRKKKGNGHKVGCKCPICKNMRKGKKGGQEPTDVEIYTQSETSKEEMPASDEDYEQLDTIQNSSGGKRKSKKRASKKQGGKTKRRRY